MHGGLGNQLFQYALGKSLQSEKNEVYFDISFFEDPKKAKFPRTLDITAFLTEKLPESSCEPILKNYTDKFLDRIITRKYGVSKKLKLHILNMAMPFCSVIKEKELGYFRSLVRYHQSNLFLDGYWTDYRYFKDVLPNMRASLALRDELVSSDYLTLKQQILESPNRVAVHIRRGDYLTIKHNDRSIVLSKTFYQKSEKYFKEATFFIFSDDIEWCKSELQCFKKVIFIPGSLSDVESFELMRWFPSYIIANSTYSLWASYLSYFPGIGKVLYPVKWKNQIRYKGHRIIPQNTEKIYIGVKE